MTTLMSRTWHSRTQVDRVALYTIGSLHMIAWMFVVVFLVGLGVPRTPSEFAGFAVLLATGGTAAYVLQLGIRRNRHGTAVSVWPFAVLALLVAAAVMVAALGSGDTENWEIQVSHAALILGVLAVSPLASGQRAATIAVGAGLVSYVIVGEAPLAVLLGGAAVFLIATTRISLWMLRVVDELDAARAKEAALSVAEERLRFARDLHDVVGRALSVISVKSELATVLADRDIERAADQMREVRELANDSLREMRQLVRGYRGLDLAAEVDGARALLQSAGIDVTVEGEVADVPERFREAAAWMVREGVTNILRHSVARNCTIMVAAGAISLRNDGAPSRETDDGATKHGNGLAGLSERMNAAGAALVSRHTGSEFELRAEFPHTKRET
ncbi:sensor histidine kinase [Hoyosella subflava]|uniref:Putative two-component histidine kinase n=1 Tax=Hoyosella subflava (strain DSM 45089 / JCM 17490 / NBRC 109087 / DQS3-9A1) TaxID=443218 RepID=F6ERK5_HOYSD|nr:histidine kinase [Hoyosella subflava]AEF38525.1 Putative two-component histidine kinase [Hoyosella subflava DQS3-9A1]